jgi:hypothetical protein
MNTLGSWISNLYKAYVMKNLLHDVSKVMARAMRNIDFDKESLLNRAGLTTYSPVRAAVSGVSLFAVGLIAGGALGLALAPKPGAELRREVKDRALDLINRGNEITESRARA